MTPPSAYLLDIEGTTTPIGFVTQVLFPYARRELGRFLASSGPELSAALAQLAEESLCDEAEGLGPPEWPSRPSPEGALAYLNWLMDGDRKSTGLKSIQGLVWREGYESGRLQGVVYPDVWPAVHRWKARGAGVHVFSSGSVLAQKLLFGHLKEGDLTPFLGSYFDTTTGPKREAASYSKIASQLGLAPEDVMFLSDVQEEVDAASAAGMRATRIDREGRRPGTAFADFGGLE